MKASVGDAVYRDEGKIVEINRKELFVVVIFEGNGFHSKRYDRRATRKKR